jgi:hypothetical protein
MEKMTHQLEWTNSVPQTPAVVGMRAFGTGATRDQDTTKLDFEGFLSPLVLERYAEYMHSKRYLPDGSMRDSDNWQLGIPVQVYIKSLFRHFFAVWKAYRAGKLSSSTEDMCAVLFNQMGLLHEILKIEKK